MEKLRSFLQVNTISVRQHKVTCFSFSLDLKLDAWRSDDKQLQDYKHVAGVTSTAKKSGT